MNISFFYFQGNTMKVLLFIGCFIIISVLAQDFSEDYEDQVSLESTRSSRFLRWPSRSKKVRIKKRLGPLPPQIPPSMEPMKVVSKKRLAPRPLRSSKPVKVYKKQSRKGPLGVKMPKRGLKPAKKVPRKIHLPKGPPKSTHKKHKKVQKIVQKPVVSNEVFKLKRQPPSLRYQKKQGLVADERFFFPNRGSKRRPRPQKYKRPSGGYRRPKPRPKPSYSKPKPTKAATYKTTTKKATYKPTKKPTYEEPSYEEPEPSYEAPAPSYQPSSKPQSYDIEVTTYSPPKSVYEPSKDVDNFPKFPSPNFPDLSSDFMPNFDFEISKINCK